MSLSKPWDSDGGEKFTEQQQSMDCWKVKTKLSTLANGKENFEYTNLGIPALEEPLLCTPHQILLGWIV